MLSFLEGKSFLKFIVTFTELDTFYKIGQLVVTRKVHHVCHGFRMTIKTLQRK